MVLFRTSKEEIADEVRDLFDMRAGERVLSGDELIFRRQRERRGRDTYRAIMQLPGIAGPDDACRLRFTNELCTDRIKSRDVTLDQPGQAFALSATLHGHQSMKLWIFCWLFNELSHPQPQLRRRIAPLESANALAEPGEKTSGQLI